jgi:hypothetical protein
MPPVDMLRDNIGSTAMSGLAEIVTSKKTSLDGKTPAPTTGYVNVRYEVRVLRWFSGSGPDQLVLHQGAEAQFSPRGPGELLFFSACALAPGEATEPDVGYFFPIDPACRATAEKRGESAAKRAGSKHGARACKKH